MAEVDSSSQFSDHLPAADQLDNGRQKLKCSKTPGQCRGKGMQTFKTRDRGEKGPAINATRGHSKGLEPQQVVMEG